MAARQSLEESESNSAEKSKAIRLIYYLTRLASLRAAIIRDINEYHTVLWLKDIPRQKGCFTQAWGRDEDSDSEVWIEVQTRREPELPSVPDLCEDWIEKPSLRNKSGLPRLISQIKKQVKNPDRQEGSRQPEFITLTEHLEDHPEVQEARDEYVEKCWLPWVEAHNVWEEIHKVYSILFAIHQEQRRLGEEYELVLGLGLLAWKTPTGQCTRRHLIVANALLEFEAHLGKFIVRPMADGARVRPELDMLDTQDQPARAEEKVKPSLTDADDDPWEKSCIEEVLQTLVHSLSSQGQYDSTLEAKSVPATNKPVIEYAPALILRKRSTKGLTETLKRVREKIEKDNRIFNGFRDLAEIGLENDANPENDPGEANSRFDGEVFFPKPSNEDQRRIVEKIRGAKGVLVQGPPGTGKSHTIANLICHLLATGQRTLITAKTPRALQVLEGQLPDELRPLCINLLGSGLEEKQSLEASVNGILRKSEGWDEIRAAGECKELEQKLRQLREEKSRVDRRLRDIRESEAHSQSIAEGTYQGTAARIAEAVNRDRSRYEWFTDTISLNSACSISKSDLQGVLVALRRFTPEKQQELNLTWLDALPPPEHFTRLVKDEQKTIEEKNESAIGADERIAKQLFNIDVASINEIREAFFAFHATRRQLLALNQPWMSSALHDITGGNSSLWRELSRVTRETVNSIEKLAPVADDTHVDFPEGTLIRRLFDEAYNLVEYLEKGGKIGWGPFRPKLVKEHIHILKTVRINGRLCSDLGPLSMLVDILWVQIQCEKAWGFWVGHHEPPQGPYALQLQMLKALCDTLDSALSLEGLMGKCREALQQCPSLGEPGWIDESQIERLIASCQLALASHAERLVVREIGNIEDPIISLAVQGNIHPVMSELLQATRNRDIDRYAYSVNKIQELERERQSVQETDKSIEKLRSLAPGLVDALERTYRDSCWETHVEEIQAAWHWAQARFWIEEYINADDAPSLSRRAHQIEDEINKIIAKLASLHAWSYCFSRLQESHRRHMVAWQQSIGSIGKGTGKHASRKRREAQQHLNACCEAVPAWIMPLHRVWDTVDPAPGLFDVVIVDEASQCGFEALPLLYLSKKIVIVGDDKQISPEAVGDDRASVYQLMDQYLYDFEHRNSFDIDRSLFDHGKLRYGTQQITLREHFRCMPEIIRFSNDLCYSGTPLIPLRQYGPERLTPLEHIFVEGGYREGSYNRVINRPEADRIVEKIVELCSDERYIGKTMGVVVLQGDAQARLIEEQLLKKLGAEEMERRRLVCGNSSNFQGDERDIIFLSMVAAPNERIGPFTKAADERRFNVAASRAHDQMFLFHSVTRNDLSIHDLRRRLLEFFEDTRPDQIPGVDRDELERRAAQDNRTIINPPDPFDSWFEVDVALELVRKGFSVLPQYEVAGRRIDLVVEGGQTRLAVECDGDYWHGVDRYEDDMHRQRILERCGWEFFRVRESAFYSNKEGALQRLWQMLEERKIYPGTWGGNPELGLNADEEDCDEYDSDEAEEAEESSESFYLLPPSPGESARNSSGRRAEEVIKPEIQNAILQALSKCLNQSCKLDFMTSRVLKELGILTRGNPRIEFEKRVNRSLDEIERQGLIEKYKAKNWRIRLRSERIA